MAKPLTYKGRALKRPHIWQACLSDQNLERRNSCMALARALDIGKSTWLCEFWDWALSTELAHLRDECRAQGLDPEAILRSARRKKLGLEPDEKDVESGCYVQPGPKPPVD